MPLVPGAATLRPVAVHDGEPSTGYDYLFEVTAIADGPGEAWDPWIGTKSPSSKGPPVITYRAILDVPRELVTYVSGLLRAHRRALGTRRETRRLTRWRQAMFGLAWVRNRGVDVAQLGAGFGLSRATSYRYRDGVLAVLSAQAPNLTEALHRVADEGWSYVILDGKVVDSNRCAQKTSSRKVRLSTPGTRARPTTSAATFRRWCVRTASEPGRLMWSPRGCMICGLL